MQSKIKFRVAGAFLVSVLLIFTMASAKSDVLSKTSYEFLSVSDYQSYKGNMQHHFASGVMDALRLFVTEKLPKSTSRDCLRKREPPELSKLRILIDIGERVKKGQVEKSDESAAAFRIIESYRKICDDVKIAPQRTPSSVTEIERSLFLFYLSRLVYQELYLEGVLDTLTYAQRVGAPSAEFVRCIDESSANKPLLLHMELMRWADKMTLKEKIRNGAARVMIDQWVEICGGFTATHER